MKRDFIYIEELGLGVGGVLTDLRINVICRAFKPLPAAGVDDARHNGPLLRKTSSNGLSHCESILSNSGCRRWLWRFSPLSESAAAREGEKSLAAPVKSSVRKPIYSREGGNVTVIFDERQNKADHADGDYATSR